MEYRDYETGMTEIGAFFPQFKPSLELQERWYQRLKFAHKEAWLQAVRDITYSFSKAPTFPEILGKVKARQAKYSKGEFWVVRSGGCPLTPEKYELVKSSMADLRKVLDKKITPEEAVIKWHSGYRKLPNYVSEWEVEIMAQQGQFYELFELGLIEGQYQIGQGKVGFMGLR